MAIVLTGTATITKPSGNQTAAQLTTLLATAPEAMTIQQLHDLVAATKSKAGGDDPTQVVGALLA